MLPPPRRPATFPMRSRTEAVRVLPRAAGPERPERLPALRPAASRPSSAEPQSPAAAAAARGGTRGCGGDDEPAETTRELPELSPEKRGRPHRGADGAPSTTVDPATETLPARGTAAVRHRPADTPESDTAPPQDSPAERFEEYCNENPGACG